MVIVLDNSVVLAWCMADEENHLAEAAIDAAARGKGAAPAIWWYELRNALLMNERRGRLQPGDTEAILADVRDLGIEVDHDHDEAAVVALARRQNFSVYDAAYLEVARRRDLPLATLGRNLARACKAEQVALFEI